MQGRMQLEYLKNVVDCREATVWGLNQEEVDAYRRDMETKGFKVETTLEPEDIASTCNLIVTCTPSKSPLLELDQVQKGIHITAMGSDTQAIGTFSTAMAISLKLTSLSVIAS